MRKFRNLLFYVCIIGSVSFVMYCIVQAGSVLELGRHIVQPTSDKGSWGEFVQTFSQNIKHPLALLLAQIVTIIFAARLFGWVCKKIGQPSVVGEIIAGIVLGPSLLGMYFPHVSHALFPIESLGNLQLLSQIGLILFMFTIGMELDTKVLKNKAHDAVVISHASIIIPFGLGMGLAYYIYTTFAPMGVKFSSFAMFLGVAMSITAFPVLARIIQERNIHKTKLGTIVITCAAADDITGWVLLASIIAIVKAGSFVSSIHTILLALAYVFLMIKVVRPFLRRVGDLHSTKESLNKSIVGLFFIVIILSSYATEVIGIHALFGAFMAGAIMPDNPKFRNAFTEKVEDIALVLLLPLFFVYTGLRTEIGLINDVYLWKITGLIILVAISGKFFGSALAAKFVGQNWRDSLTIGVLMNTRGLMELIVLNIGYDLGVLNPQIFTMMIIMALITTFITGPLLSLINKIFKPDKEEYQQAMSNFSKYKVLISFGNADRGKSLLRLANSLVKKLNGNAQITAMHLSSSNEMKPYNIEDYENEVFAPIIEESKNLNQKVLTLFKPSNNIDDDIAELANKGDYDLLLIGVGQSIYEGSLLGKILGFTTKIINPDRLINQMTGKESLFENSPFDERTRTIISNATIPVGIFVDKSFVKADSVFIPILDKNDVFLIRYAQKLINNSGAQISVIDVNNQLNKFTEIKELIRNIEQIAPSHISVYPYSFMDSNFLKQQDLMLISIDCWKKAIDNKRPWLTKIPSTLILNAKI
ncbi:MAG: cation:proton antiporter [Paludibacteraceae bacterium]|nr:cation:proton antiporter [Paludibacteraceae bacterium]